MKTKKKYYIISIENKKMKDIYYVKTVQMTDEDEISVWAHDIKNALRIKTIDIARSIANIAKLAPNQMFGSDNIIKIHCITENDEIVE
jgi:hypothetical protein